MVCWSEPANTDLPLDLLEFLVPGDERGYAVNREHYPAIE